MKKIYRIYLLLLAILRLFFSVETTNVFAQGEDYAQLVLGTRDTMINLSADEAMTAVQRQGRYGKKTSISDKSIYLYIDIADSFMYDLPDNTPVEITVEYYDEGTGSFELNYDSNQPEVMDIYSAGDAVSLTNTGEWKSYTWHIEDGRFSNRVVGGKDFRIGVWGISMGWSSSDVIFGSVTVKYADYNDLVTGGKVTSERYGNIFDKDEEIALNVTYTNKTYKEIGFECEAKAYDANNSVVYKETFAATLGPGEEKLLTLKPGLGNTYGIYTLHLDTCTYFTDNPEKKYYNKAEGQFSRVMKVAEEDINPMYGVNQQVTSMSRGDAVTTAALMKESGMSFIRDNIPWIRVEKTKGVYKITDDDMSNMNKLIDSGLEVLFMLGYTNVNYDGGKTPVSDEAIAGFANYCAYIAREFKGRVKYFEVWNEYNGGTGFNPSQAPPETYAKMLKAAYKAIKGENPDAVVIGIDTAEIDLEWAERVFKEGGYDYMDAVSVHPYDWNFNSLLGNYRWSKLIEETQQLKELMLKYGDEKPVWFTEVGFSSCTDKYTQLEQAGNTVLLYSFIRAYDLCDVLTQYCFYDRESRDEIEDNWGYVNYWLDDIAPDGAKKSYAAVCAMNNFIGGMADYRDKIDTDTKFHAFHFYNNKMGADVVAVMSEIGAECVTYDLGCSDVSLYDIYGNKIGDLHSDSGVYRINVSISPKYIVGNITSFKTVEDKYAPVTVEFTNISAVADEYITFRFHNNTDKNLHIEMSGADCLKVVENKGFIDGSAELKVYTLPSSEGEIDVNIIISDDNGKAYYADTHKITVTDAVGAAMAAEQAVENSNTHWRVRTVITNKSISGTYSGTVKVISPDEEAAYIPERRFEALEPGAETTILLNLPERIVKKTVDFKIRITLDNGNFFDFEQALDFGSSSYAVRKPVIDGVISSDEWNSSWIGADESKDVKQIVNWKGAGDLSFGSTSMWDEDNFYLMAIVTDDVYSLNYSPKEPHYMYKGDNIQFGMSDAEFIDPALRTEFTEIGVANVQGYGSKAYRYKSLHGLPAKVIIEDADIVVKRYDTYTVYECRIPWTEIFGEDFKPYAGQKLRFSVLANDNDGTGRRGWIEYTSGIGYTKDVSEFGSLVLSK